MADHISITYEENIHIKMMVSSSIVFKSGNHYYITNNHGMTWYHMDNNKKIAELTSSADQYTIDHKHMPICIEDDYTRHLHTKESTILTAMHHDEYSDKIFVYGTPGVIMYIDNTSYVEKISDFTIRNYAKDLPGLSYHHNLIDFLESMMAVKDTQLYKDEDHILYLEYVKECDGICINENLDDEYIPVIQQFLKNLVLNFLRDFATDDIYNFDHYYQNLGKMHLPKEKEEKPDIKLTSKGDIFNG